MGTAPRWKSGKLILLFLAEKQAKNGDQYTTRIRCLEISVGYDLPLDSVQTQVKRLIKKGYVELVDGKRGRGRSGCVYRIPAAVFTAILACKENLNGNRKWEPNRNQMGTGAHVSSNDLNSTTTTNGSHKMFLKKLSVFGGDWFGKHLAYWCFRIGTRFHWVGWTHWWFEKLSLGQLRELLKPYPAISNPRSLMAKEMLIDFSANETLSEKNRK